MSYLVLEPVIAGSRWEWRQLRRVTSRRRETNALRDKVLLSLSAYRGLEPRAEDGGRQPPSEETEADYWVVKPNDLVFNPMWAIEGGVAVSAIEGAVSPAYRIYQFGSDIYPRFAHHFLRSHLAISQYRLLVRGVTTFDRSVTRGDFEAMPIPVPPLSEQRAIADHLDKQTAYIDELVAKNQQTVGLLRERRAALITAAVIGELEVAP